MSAQTQTMEQKFEHMMDLERAHTLAKATEGFGWDPDTRWRAKQDAKKAKQAVYEALDNLTREEQVTYGIWRRQQR